MPPLTFDQITWHKKQFFKILHNIKKNGIKWEPGKDVAHLEERKRRGDIRPDVTLEKYNNRIYDILTTPSHKLILHSDGYKYAVSNGKDWMVIIHPSSIIETCFPVSNYRSYLVRKGFQPIATIREVEEYAEV